VVPKDAVVAKNGKFYVYVINAKNGVEKRVVQVGARGDVMAEILGGLKDGERIAVNNLARLRSGMIIVPKQLSPVDRGDNS